MQKFDDVRRLTSKFQNNDILHETPSIDVLTTLTFNENTKWTDATMPKKILEYGKIPPLDVKKLHEMGVDGSGVNVAIIDQPLALDHPEYKGKIKEYKVFMPENYNYETSSMHGPAVTSLLVGENIGVAPKANVFYAACPSWLRDAQYEANALNWILSINKNLSPHQKIKFVSVSAAPGSNIVRDRNTEMWCDAVKKAKKEGVLVIECTQNNRFVRPGYVDYNNGEFKYGFPESPIHELQEKKISPPTGEVFVPNSLRTIAESYDNKNFSYQYAGQGGLSWGIPFAVGVLVLGQQTNKNLTAFELKEKLVKSAENNYGVIQPLQFIKLLELANNKKMI